MTVKQILCTLVVCLLILPAATIWALDGHIETVDNFEWAEGVDASAYYDSLVAKGWNPREKADEAANRHPDITISNQAREGDYCLEITEQRNDDDYLLYSYEKQEPGYGDWSEYNYLSFWAKASLPIDAGTGAVKVYTRDFEDGWGKLDPVTIGTEWTYIVYELFEDKTMIDSLRYFRIFCRGDRDLDLPWKMWIDNVQVHKEDPRGPACLVDDFEWGVTVVPDDEIDSLRANNWKTRQADYDSTEGWTIFPDYGLSDDAYNGKRAMEVTAVREDYDYVKYNYEYEDDEGVMHYQDLSMYNYLSFYMKGSIVISDEVDAAKIYLRDATASWIKFSTLPVDTTYQFYVIDLNSASLPTEREQVRYIRFHCYNRDETPIPYSLYLDDIWLTAWDPRQPDQPLTAVSSRPVHEKTPQSFVLDQNYPNPFNPSTNISFTLSKQNNVELTVFDLLGRHVKTLANQVLPEGDHQISWDGTTDSAVPAPSGVYFYQLKVDNQTSTKKMILIK